MSRRILVTSALPYANGPIHMGHLVEYIQTDIWVRFQRLMGHTCVYVCADDAHGTPIMLRARNEGIEPAELVARTKQSHEADFAAFHISFDSYHTTHSEENRLAATRIYERLRDGGHITRRTIEQAYDPVAQMFLPDRFIKGTCPTCKTPDQYGDACESCGATYSPTDLIDPVSVVSGVAPIRKDSEHLFFRLADFEPELRAWTQSDSLQDSVRNKLQEWFEGGLHDWDISRDAPYWGFEIPDAPGKYFYVWLDAPVGYQASHQKWCTETGANFDEVWAPDSTWELYHFIGKDISYFHTLFWPAMLVGAGYRTPTAVHVHGFLKVDGQKMSKSRGTFINARTYLDHLPAEALRYYFASKLNAKVEDIDLAFDDFVFRVNSDLLGKVVNIASRCGAIVGKQYDHTLAATLEDQAMYDEALNARAEVAALYEAREFGRALRLVSALADRTNKYIDERAPWALVRSEDTFEQGRAVCTQALNQFRVLITLLAPVVPSLTEAAMRFLGTELSWTGVETPLLGTRIQPYEPLLLRLDRKQVDAIVRDSLPAGQPVPVPAPPATPVSKTKSKPKEQPVQPPAEISIDDFMKVELRIGKVLHAAPVEGADKLLQLTIDLGTEQRNIFAGIKAAYPAEELIGRLVVVAANLAPRKMRFGMSEGMVLAAGDGRPYLLSPDEGAEVGMRVR